PRMFFAFDLREQELQAAPAELTEVLTDCRERRREVGSCGDVIKTDQADVARHLPPRFSQAAQEPEGHLIVTDEDRREIVVIEESFAELVTGARRPITPEDRRHRRSRRLESRLPTQDTLFGFLPIGGACEMPNGLMTQAQEMPRGGRSTGALIDRRGRYRSVLTSFERHNRHVRTHVSQSVHATSERSNHGDTIHALIEELLNRV